MIKAEIVHTIKDLRIYIDGILHVHLLSDKYVGMQAWIDGDKHKRYCIEISVSGGKSILMTYQKVEVWNEVLRLMDENL